MAGIHGADSIPQRSPRYSQPLRVPKQPVQAVDQVASIKDDLLRHFNKLTKKLSNNQCIVLARELQQAFKTVEEFCGVTDSGTKSN